MVDETNGSRLWVRGSPAVRSGRGRRGSFGGPGAGRGRGRGRGRPWRRPRGGSPSPGGTSFRGRGSLRGGASGLVWKKKSSRPPLTGPFIELSAVIAQQLGLDPREIYSSSVAVSNLPKIRVQDADGISSYFAKCTNITVERMIFRKPSDAPLFAICVLKSKGDKSRFVEKLHGQVFHGHHLLADYTSSHVHRSPHDHCIKVTNLSTGVTEEMLWKLFDGCGEIEMICLYATKSGSTQEALVSFKDTASLTKALKLDGVSLENSIIKLVLLDTKLSIKIITSGPVASLVSDFNPVHVQNFQEIRLNGATVWFPDQETYTRALALDGQIWKFGTVKLDCVKKGYQVYLLVNQNTPKCDIRSVFKCRRVQKSNHGSSSLITVEFESKEEADAALKASPVLIKDKLVTVHDSPPKLQKVKKCKEEDLDEGNNKSSEEEEGEEVDQVEVSGNPWKQTGTAPKLQKVKKCKEEDLDEGNNKSSEEEEGEEVDQVEVSGNPWKQTGTAASKVLKSSGEVKQLPVQKGAKRKGNEKKIVKGAKKIKAQ